MLESGTHATAGWTLIAAVAVATLAGNMPAHGFFSGDPGVKLIAAFNAAQHPSRPFEIDLPRVGGRPAPWIDRFFQVHGDHAHALQSPVFPVVSAPFVALAGIRGAYILPALGFVVLVPLVEAMRRALVPSVSPLLLGLFSVIASPVFFYGLEFWEHTPAVAALAACTAVLARPTPVRAQSPARAIGAGLLGAVAILLRPESAWYLAGLCIALRLPPRAYVSLMVGAATILVPFAAANGLHSGNLLGPHAAANLAPLGDRWLATRFHRAALWLLPSSAGAAVGAVLIACSWMARLPPVRRDLPWLALLGGLSIAGSAAMGNLPRESLWTAWPVGVLVLAGFRRDRGRDILLSAAGITTIGVLLTSTHDGGAQWGPRFLLIASPALMLLAAVAAQDLLQQATGRRLVALLVVLIAVCGAAATRLAYRELRGSKRYYARVVDATARVVPAGGHVLTDVWWFAQITAALHQRHTVLVATEPGAAREVVGSLERAGIRSFVAVHTSEEPSRLLDGLAATCYRVDASERIPERSLAFETMRCLPSDRRR